MVARLQPGHAPGPGDVEQHPPSHDPVAGHVDRQRSPVTGRSAGVHSVVQRSVEDDVTQGVDVAVGVAVHVHRQTVHGELQAGCRRPVTGAEHLVAAGFGVVPGGHRLDRRGQRDSPPRSDLADRGQYVRGGEVVQGAASVVRAARCRVPELPIQRIELRRREAVCAGVFLGSRVGGHRRRGLLIGSWLFGRRWAA